MAVTRTSSTGFLGNLFNSILAIPIGILIFLASFAVLFLNEGRPNIGKIADRQSVAVDSDDTDDGDGEFVSVTDDLMTAEMIGDPEYVAPANYIRLERVVEQYVWVEHSESRTRDKVGGGTETTTTYTYEMEWSSNPPNSANFEEPAGHQNPPQRIEGDSFRVDEMTVGDWEIAMDDMESGGGCLIGCRGMPSGETLDLNSNDITLIGEASKGTVAGDYLYMDGSPSSQTIGDHRISFRALLPGDEVTAFGLADDGALVPFEFENDKTVLRIVRGDREAAIETLKFEAKMAAWGLRILGFFLMWMGMQMVFSPLHAIAGILPWAKKATKFIIAAITFPIAFVLTTITVVVSMILNNVIALIVVFAITIGIGVFFWKRRSKPGATGAGNPPAGMPPGGMGFAPPGGGPGVPPGPAPGAPPGPPPA